MKVTGLITEYNPFHKGHEYHIQMAKELTQADYVIAIMSGDFVQRGTPACVPKHIRANMALLCGADLVLELPVTYATGSAELFAEGAVSILDKLGVVNTICFGCECGQSAPLLEIADILVQEPAWYQTALQKQLKKGLSYPAARAAALPDYAEILSSPNNILGIEYCKALLRLRSKIQPAALKRQGSFYHENNLIDELPSATALRNYLYKPVSTAEFETIPTNMAEQDTCLSEHIPSDAYRILMEEVHTNGILHEDDFSQILLYKLLLADSPKAYELYEDVSEELASRIYKHRTEFLSFSQFADLLKTKEITRTRINRALVHIVLNIKKNTPKSYYGRILGFKKSSQKLLSQIKQSASIPFFSKITTSADLLDDAQKEVLDLSIQASMIYEGAASQKNGRPLKHESSKQIILLP